MYRVARSTIICVPWSTTAVVRIEFCVHVRVGEGEQCEVNIRKIVHRLHGWLHLLAL